MPLQFFKSSNSSSSVNSTPGSSPLASVAGGGGGGDSPLFGVRKQISFSSQQENSKGTGSNFITSNQQSINTNLSSKDSNNNNNNYQNAAQSSTNSIPQHITSQQIHFAFDIMDSNRDGLIDLSDLSQMLANLKVPISEAILAHVMSSVSKRGDHRISEAEFLEWISKFIQVGDQGVGKANQQADLSEKVSGANSRNKQPSNRKRNAVSSSGGSISRSSTTGSSSSQLVAQNVAPAEVTYSRRGSGSGLALMRSLSSSAAFCSNASLAAPPVASTSTAGSAPTISSSSLSLSSSPSSPSSSFSNNFKSSNSKSHDNDLQQQQDLDTIHDLKAAFCVFDLDADGYITIDEVQAGLKLLGESWSPNELKQLLSKCSSNSSPASSKSQDLNKLSKRQQEQQLLKQRISIDDFVRLLL